METYKDVATIGSTSHLDGRLVLVPKAGLPLLIEPGMDLFLVPPQIDAPRKVRVTFADGLPDGSCIARFDGIDSIESAEVLVGMHCLARLEDLPEVDFLPSEVESGGFDGWRFHDSESGLSGAVLSTWHSAGQDLCQLLLDGEDVEDEGHVVPLPEDFVEQVDEELEILRLKLPRGIFEI